MTPHTEVCHYCEDFHTTIQCTTTEYDKATHLAEFGKHLEDAQNDDAYIIIAALELSKTATATGSEPNFGHLSFDIAQ